LARLDARPGRQQRPRPVRGRCGGRGGDVAEDARVSQAGESDPAHPHAALGEAREPASAALEGLATRGVARAGEPPRAHTHDGGEVVCRADLDELTLHAELAEEDDTPRLS